LATVQPESEGTVGVQNDEEASTLTYAAVVDRTAYSVHSKYRAARSIAGATANPREATPAQPQSGAQVPIELAHPSSTGRRSFRSSTLRHRRVHVEDVTASSRAISRHMACSSRRRPAVPAKAARGDLQSGIHPNQYRPSGTPSPRAATMSVGGGMSTVSVPGPRWPFLAIAPRTHRRPLPRCASTACSACVQGSRA